MSNIGDNDYRSGALDRLEDASHLLREERFAGSVYLAGRAVEGMLRAIIWRSDHEYATGKKSLETGHNLRDILKLTRRLGILQDEKIHDEIANSIQTIARLWWNNMRFLSSRKIEAL
jgi:HEPN domain-containing protein